MASHTPVGSVVADAFQWSSRLLSAVTTVLLPVWAKRLALHTPDDGTLHIPTGGSSGTLAVLYS